jgi:hypothetical protein
VVSIVSHLVEFAKAVYSPDVTHAESGDTDCYRLPWRSTKRKIAAATSIAETQNDKNRNLISNLKESF